MKKKVCSWLDGNQQGVIRFETNTVFACCYRSIPLIKDVDDFSKLSVEELIKSRKALYEGINDKTRNECDGCNLIKDVDEEDICLDKISCLVILPYTTCNLRCKYCYLSHDQLGVKMNENEKKLLPIIKNLYQQNLLSENFEICLGGGEPTLLDDLGETLQFLSANFKNPTLKLKSNWTIKSKIEEFIKQKKEMRDIDNVQLKLYTSVDCGTATTYKRIRGANLFYSLVYNLINSVKNKVFDLIELKYLLLEDNSNMSDEEIFSFLLLMCSVKKTMDKYLNFSGLALVIDAEYCDNRIETNDVNYVNNVNSALSEKMIEAAGKLYYVATEVLDINVLWSGGRITRASKDGQNDIENIIKYSEKYKNMKKSSYETAQIEVLSAFADNADRKISLSKFFSLTLTKKQLIFNVLGIKIKIGREKHELPNK